MALLEATDEFRSAQQLHAALREQGAGVGLTTVYRTLQLLSDAGEVDQMRLPDGEHQVEFEEHEHEQDATSAANRDHNIRSAYIHVIADAAVSVLAIIGLLLARAF